MRKGGSGLGTVAIALVLVAAVMSGCSASKGPNAADRLIQLVGTPEWATEVYLDSGSDDRGRWASFIIRLGPSATPDDVTDLIVGMPDLVEQAGLDRPVYPPLAFLTNATRARMDVNWTGEMSARHVARGVEEWFRVTQEFAGVDLSGGAVASSVSTSLPSNYHLTLPEGPRSAVAAASTAMSQLARRDSSWGVSATAGGLEMAFATAAPPTAAQVTTWSALLGAVDRLPDGLPASYFGFSQLTPTTLSLVVLVPDGTDGASLTVAAYGDRLWPAIRAQLKTMAELDLPWTYDVRWAPLSDPGAASVLMYGLSDKPVPDYGDVSTSWSRAAKKYVDSLEAG